jgi:hypothetical protein
MNEIAASALTALMTHSASLDGTRPEGSNPSLTGRSNQRSEEAESAANSNLELQRFELERFPKKLKSGEFSFLFSRSELDFGQF